MECRDAPTDVDGVSREKKPGAAAFVRGSAKFQQLLDGDPCFVQNLAQRPETHLSMVRHDDAGVRVAAPQDDVAPLLAVNDKPHPQEHLHQLLAGEVRGELH